MKSRDEHRTSFSVLPCPVLSCILSPWAAGQDQNWSCVLSCRTGQDRAGQDIQQDKYNSFSSFLLNDTYIKFSVIVWSIYFIVFSNIINLLLNKDQLHKYKKKKHNKPEMVNSGGKPLQLQLVFQNLTPTPTLTPLVSWNSTPTPASFSKSHSNSNSIIFLKLHSNSTPTPAKKVSTPELTPAPIQLRSRNRPFLLTKH